MITNKKLAEINLHLKYSKWCKKAPEGFEPSISCLLDRRFNQLSHGALAYLLGL